MCTLARARFSWSVRPGADLLGDAESLGLS